MDAVESIARRLSDPDAVRRTVLRGDEWVEHAEGVRIPTWNPLSLGTGLPAVTLLYAELGRSDPAYRTIAHRYLTRAVGHVAEAAVGGLHGGIAALAFALRMSAQRAGEYETILTKLDDAVYEQCRRLIEAETARMERGHLVSVHAYDTVSGLTGLGRYLLLAGGRAHDELAQVLRCLVGLTRPVGSDSQGGRSVGWLVGHPPFLGQDNPSRHINLGLAHGIAGPLALFALAWEAGVRVPGQDLAAQRVADWLLEHRGQDESGRYWPAFLSEPQLTAPPRCAPAWCYGSLGTARAVQLAGRAFGEPAWSGAAREVIAGEAECIRARPAGGECGLCHGWAGVLHVLARFEQDAPGTVPVDLPDLLVERLLAGARQDSAFLFPYRRPNGGIADEPGLVQGAAGVALALTRYADPDAPGCGWDAALMLG
jgi:hypothetical protein